MFASCNTAMYKTRIKELTVYDFLAKNNLSQKDLAARLGVSPGYLSQLLCGSRYPSPNLRRRMLETLDPLGFHDLFSIQTDEATEEAGA